MEKSHFFAALRRRLEELQVSEENIDKYIRQFERYFNTMTDEEAEEQIASFEGVEGIASNILRMIQKKESQEAPPPPVAPVSEPEEDATEEEEYPVEEELPSERTRVIPVVPARPEKGASDALTQTRAMPAVQQIPSRRSTVPAAAPTYENVNFNELDEEEEEDIDYDQYGYQEEIDPEFEEKIPSSMLYWVILLASSPISLAIFGVIFALFGAVFGAMAVAVAGGVLAMLAIVVAGTAMSLVGIIYGVTQLFVSLPIGLFELGLGVVIGGVTMLSGILIYNFAVRLLPYLMRYWVVFLRFVLRQIRRLYRFIKKECAKQ